MDELLEREQFCRKHGSNSVSASAVRRQGMIEGLLKCMDGFMELQKRSYDETVRGLQSKYNEKNLKQSKEYVTEIVKV